MTTREQLARIIQDKFRFVTFTNSDGDLGWRLKEGNIEEIADAILALPPPEPTEGLREALTLAEDVLSRAPFSTEIWPNGMHPNEGIAIIRAALRAMPLQQETKA